MAAAPKKTTKGEKEPKVAEKGPRTTVVPDRSAWPLGSEAKLIAGFLRGVGADGARAVRPGITSDEERKDWLASRSHPAKHVPMWMLDYAVAILEQIHDRPDQRERGRPRDTATERVELLKGEDSIAKTALLVVTLDAGREEFETGKPVSEEQIEERKEKLARRVYRLKRRRNVP